MRQVKCLLAFSVLLVTCGLAAGQCSPCSIWTPSSTPTLADSGDSSSTELGVKFRADSDGYVTGVRFYKSAANGGTHIGNLWSSSGTLLASAQFSGESASGWQQVNFGTPVLISGGTTYVVSYFAPQGHYAFDVRLSLPRLEWTILPCMPWRMVWMGRTASTTTGPAAVSRVPPTMPRITGSTWSLFPRDRLRRRPSPRLRP